jgi:hypothetical protein
MSGSEKTAESRKLVAYSAAMGVLRSMIGFPLEQPMESVKTQW